MTFRDHIRIWEIKNPGKGYMDDITVSTNAIVDKDILFNYLQMEYLDMEVIDDDTWFFHERVKNFFDIHRWNIDELAKTLEYKYEPLENGKWKKRRDLTDNKNRDMLDDKTYEESGSHNITDVHYVSAFNEDESPEQTGVDANGVPIYKYNDTEHDRDTESKRYNFNGTNNDVLSETTKQDVGEDIVFSGNDGIPYQDYIKKQRDSVQYNIYKWIARHFCKELLVAIW